MIACAILEKSCLSYRNQHLWPNPHDTHHSEYASVGDSKQEKGEMGFRRVLQKQRQPALPTQGGISR